VCMYNRPLYQCSVQPITCVHATDPCTITNYCNGRSTSCSAGRCTCQAGYFGVQCEGTGADLTVDGQALRLQVAPMVNWTQAQATCRSWGMELAMVTSHAHMIKVNQALRDATWLGSTVSNWKYAWIGLNDRDKEGVYTWTGFNVPLSSTPLNTISAWEAGQPDDLAGAEDCVEMKLWKETNFNSSISLLGAMNDLPCATLQPLLCSAGKSVTGSTVFNSKYS